MREIGRLVLAAGVGEAELQRRRAVKSHPAGGELNRHEHWSFWALVGIGHLNIAPRCHPDADASRIPNCSETVEGTLAGAPIDNSRDVKTLKHGGLQPMAQDYRTPLIRKGRAQEARSIDTLPAEPQAIRIDLVRRTRAR